MWPPSRNKRPTDRRLSGRCRRRPIIEALETRQMLSTFTVTSASDSGTGTLRQAIIESDNTPGSNTINFNVPGQGPITIALGSALPAITNPVVIDATTQPGTPGLPGIELNGSGAGAGTTGLDLEPGASGTSSTPTAIKGLELNGFSGSGLVLNGASYVNVSLDDVGVAWQGTASGFINYTARGNGGDGVVLTNQAAHDTLSRCIVANNGGNGVTLGAGANQDSVANSALTANRANGVLITDAGTSSNVLSGDEIGDGPAAYQSFNGGDGVLVQNSASSNIVGGSTAGSGNVISGNAVCGVYIKDAGTTGNLVAGNLIGTNDAGTASDPNSINGVDIVGGASFNTVGGTTPGARNIISGNRYSGVAIAFGGTADNVVEGNFIGTDATGAGVLPNGADGVDIIGGASFNTVGGASATARNVISGNAGNGVVISDANSDSNVVASDDIGTNASGTAALGNGGDGALVENAASNNIIGGATAGSGDVISGNGVCGVYIRDPGTTGNVVAGDVIGTNAAGTAAVANGINGVDIVGGASFNTVGGTTPGARDVISGNTYNGVVLAFAGTADNLVEGDFIGTAASGTAALPNGADGVDIVGGAASNTIGGASSVSRNVISGNKGNGVVVSDSGSTNNVIEADYLGVDATGTVALANGNNGVIIQSGASADVVGGTLPGMGNVVSGNAASGIELLSTTGNSILGNRVGTNAAGTAALANGFAGVLVGASGNTVGGTALGSGNVISGNGQCGIYLSGMHDVIAGNRIGTNAAGTAAVPNQGFGLWVAGASDTVGGTAAGSGNVISGNGTAGVLLLGTGANLDLVEGNLIGTNAGGTAALPNGDGVEIESGADLNTIGGTISGARNVISGNTHDGVFISGYLMEGNVVDGNLIGTDPTGRSAIPNGANGVQISGGVIDDTIGGTSSAARNVISGNAGAGVLVSDVGTSNDTIQSNLVGTDVTGESPLPNANGVVLANGASSNIVTNNVLSANLNVGLLFTDPATTNNLSVTDNLIGLDVTGTRVVAQPGQAYSNHVGVGFENGAHGNLLEYDVISGNDVGAQFTTGATSNQLEACDIGTDAGGTLDLGNISNGVEFLQTTGNFLSFDLIYFNGGYGVYGSDFTAGYNNFGSSVFQVVINGVTYGNRNGIFSFVGL